MNGISSLMMPLVLLAAAPAGAPRGLEADLHPPPAGEQKVPRIGHASLMFQFGGKVIHVDPVDQFGDYSKLPKADLILATHDHFDHCDPKTIELLRTAKTKMVMTPLCAAKLKGSITLKNGEGATVDGILIDAVPAYNLVHMRSPGAPYHPKGAGNGYVLTFGDKRVYIAGDTENIPEMKNLKSIDYAFLPMNLPYTMTPEMVADAARMFRPKVVYPYHTTDTDTSKLQPLLKSEKGIEIRIRRMP